jgi:hypothetical protein
MVAAAVRQLCSRRCKSALGLPRSHGAVPRRRLSRPADRAILAYKGGILPPEAEPQGPPGDTTPMLLDCNHAVPALIGDPNHFLMIAGLAGTAYELASITNDGDNLFALDSAAPMAPPNLAILCVDNGHYGETGFQRSHTSLGIDLERMAIGAGIGSTMTIEREDQLAAGARMLRERNGPCFVVVRVSTADPPKDKLSLDAPAARTRFRRALLTRT